MKKILVISWFYPPINSSEGLVTYKLLKNSSLQFDICMQANTDSWSYGIDNGFLELDNVKKIHSKSKVLDDWKDEVVDYFKQHKDDYDIIMTRSMPPESHKIGLAIKEIKPSVKWIASFGDPIANNPFVLKMVSTDISPYSLKARYVRPMSLREMLSPKRMIKNILWKSENTKMQNKLLKADRILENQIVNACDYIILNSEQQKDYMLSSRSEEIQNKAIVIPHSYDSDMYGEPYERKNDKIRISYIGHLDDTRTPHHFLEAVKRLKDDCPDLEDRLEVFFYGNMSKKEKLYLIDNDLLEIVHFKNHITYHESLRVMKTCDWLLHIDANISSVIDHNIFFAAKLADYIGAGTKILGISMTEGPSADYLRDLNALLLSYSVEEIKNYLYLIAYDNFSIDMNTEAAEKFNAVNVAKRFDRFVEEKIQTNK